MADPGMTVAELREALADVPGDLPVALAIDEEGNAYRDVCEAKVEKALRESSLRWDVAHPDDVTDEHVDLFVVWP